MAGASLFCPPARVSPGIEEDCLLSGRALGQSIRLRLSLGIHFTSCVRALPLMLMAGIQQHKPRLLAAIHCRSHQQPCATPETLTHGP